jgi:ring-1,2-phenylacetyl-CoA epoxidase subunit PaaE
MKQFHPLTVAGIEPETADSVRIALAVPDEFAADYTFRPGQHLPLRITVDGEAYRRTYSICSARDERPLEIGVRIRSGGRFSEFVSKDLAVGDTLEAMPPFGGFRLDPDPAHVRDYVAFVAGSGITPILSMLRSVLPIEEQSRFAVFYGNRRKATAMFIEDLYALKNRYPERLLLHFVFSREEPEFPIAAGRLDGAKLRELYEHLCGGLNPAGFFVCGPDTMIGDVTAALVGLGVDESIIQSERFGAPKAPEAAPSAPARTAHATVTVVMDGHRTSFGMERDDANIVDAAARHGIDLPYSCKGGVCATCRCHVADGEVTMATNYALEPWEVEAGFVLACQSRPVGGQVTLDYDKT